MSWDSCVPPCPGNLRWDSWGEVWKWNVSICLGVRGGGGRHIPVQSSYLQTFSRLRNQGIDSEQTLPGWESIPSLAKSIPRNRFLGFLNVYKFFFNLIYYKYIIIYIYIIYIYIYICIYIYIYIYNKYIINVYKYRLSLVGGGERRPL